ncbi:MAG: peptidoglycan DD-metalloendopeptidase family protein, partial [Clostridia bacterium]|nr:peptidoglycan DD-metalloendopeptidase family protein [Clostridia bacterium]
SVDVSALSSYELQQQINEYESKQQQIQNKIDALQDDKESAKEKADNLQEQVDVIEGKVDLITQRVNALENEISEKQSEINKKETEISDAKELLKKRLRAICIAGASTDLLVLLSAEDYSDFLMKSDVVKRITTDTKDLMTELEDEIKVINKEKKKVQVKKAEVDSLRQELVSEQNVLDAKYKEAQGAYDDLKSTEDELEAESAEIEAEKDKLQKEFDRLAQQAAQNNNSGISVTIDGGSYGFAWPYGGSYYISSGYGYRIHPTLGYSKLHGGIDITGSGAYGKPIYSIANGTVILSSYNGSYGNCIMIDHGRYNGNSIVSLYAHCASLYVGVGQSVSKGQQIGTVGSTGRSTGPHLHFEIRYNGNRVDPLSFYSNY